MELQSLLEHENEGESDEEGEDGEAEKGMPRRVVIAEGSGGANPVVSASV